MRRFVLGGAELTGFSMDEPAASVRLLLPRADGTLEMPEWTGNQFELADGSRAPIRTFTPRWFEADTLDLAVDIVGHDHGAASDWAAAASVGDPVAVSGPGRGYTIDADASAYLLAGDETAIPAISQLLEELPSPIPVRVIVEIADPSAQLALPAHDGAVVSWHELPAGAAPGTAMIAALTALDEFPPAAWVAGEAAAIQKIRTHVLDDRGLPRSAATIRGYWKQGRSAT
jgi:NADPH-dependent ferric siderophore reductase